MHVIPSYNYTLDASEKTITLIEPYQALELSQIIRIFDLNTNDMIYDADIKRNGVSITNGVISYTSDNNIESDNDELMILINRNEVSVRQYSLEMVDRGLMFRNFHLFEMASGGTDYFLIKCGAKFPHVLLNAVGDGDCLIEFFAAPTVTDNGTLEPAGNFNFNSTNTSLTQWYSDPTLSAEGTYLARTYILGGEGVSTPSSAKAASSMEGLDIVLIPNTDFLIKFTNQAGRDIKVAFETDYVERVYDTST